MRLSAGESVIQSLDPKQKKRFSSYHRRLNRELERVNFDDRVYHKLTDEYAISPTFVRREKEYLDSVNFSQSRFSGSDLNRRLHLYEGASAPDRSWNEYFVAAKQTIMEEFIDRRIVPLQYTDDSSVAEALPKHTTHAGFVGLVTGITHKSGHLEKVSSKYLELERNAVKDGSFNRIIIPGTRTTGKGAYDENYERTGTSETASRAISIVDLYQIIGELRFAKPIQAVMQGRIWYAGGKAPDALAGIITENQTDYPYWISMDCSSYDSSLPAWLIHAAFDIIESAFEMNSYDKDVFKVIRNDFIYKVFSDVKGNLFEVTKGIPSGSMFTQIIGSLCNYLMVLTYLNHLGASKSSYRVMFMGDDNLIRSNFKIDRTNFSEYVGAMFGVTIHKEKGGQGYRTPPEFLSREWRASGVWRSPIILLMKLLFSERWRDYSQVTPEIILYSYYLAFPLGMEELIDVRLLKSKIGAKLSKGDLKHASGLTRYLIEYEAA